MGFLLRQRRRLTAGFLAILLISLLSVRWHRERLPGELPKYVLGKGVWIWHLERCEGGSISKIVKRAKEASLDYILVKTNEGPQRTNGLRRPYNPRYQVEALIKCAHAQKIKVYAWGFVYGNFPEEEAQRAIEALQLGADGYVFDVEDSFRNKRRAAEILFARVWRYAKSCYPQKLIGYSTFARVARQALLPYEVFGYYSDVAMPQAYWATFGWQPKKTAYQMCAQWLALEARMRRAGYRQAIKPIIPVAHAYRRNIAGTSYIPATELKEFLEAIKGYYGVSVWAWDFMGKEHWQLLREAPLGLKDQRARFPQATQPGPLSITLQLDWLWWLLSLWLLGAVLFAALVLYQRRHSSDRFCLAVCVALGWPYLLYRGLRE